MASACFLGSPYVKGLLGLLRFVYTLNINSLECQKCKGLGFTGHKYCGGSGLSLLLVLTLGGRGNERRVVRYGQP